MWTQINHCRKTSKDWSDCVIYQSWFERLTRFLRHLQRPSHFLPDHALLFDAFLNLIHWKIQRNSKNTEGWKSPHLWDYLQKVLMLFIGSAADPCLGLRRSATSIWSKKRQFFPVHKWFWLKWFYDLVKKPKLWNVQHFFERCFCNVSQRIINSDVWSYQNSVKSSGRPAPLIILLFKTVRVLHYGRKIYCEKVSINFCNNIHSKHFWSI